VIAMTRRMAEIIARHSGKPLDQVMRDIDRDRFMTPGEACEYGLIDEIVAPRARAA
jgi:ATP-dependent Clp protease, protease subunit